MFNNKYENYEYIVCMCKREKKKFKIRRRTTSSDFNAEVYILRNIFMQ